MIVSPQAFPSARENIFYFVVELAKKCSAILSQSGKAPFFFIVCARSRRYRRTWASSSFASCATVVCRISIPCYTPRVSMFRGNGSTVMSGSYVMDCTNTCGHAPAVLSHERHSACGLNIDYLQSRSLQVDHTGTTARFDLHHQDGDKKDNDLQLAVPR